MTISILTLFPAIFASIFNYATIKRAINKKKVEIKLVDIRDFATDKHKTVDDKPYGGGAGMILKIDVLVAALEAVIKADKKLKTKIILLSPQGQKFTDHKAQKLAKLNHLVLICGRYEGVDTRISNFINEELSIGDYILSGGEMAAAVVVDAVVRQIPQVLSKKESVQTETFYSGLLKYPQYTKPFEFRGLKVPAVLLSGDHQRIRSFRQRQAKELTLAKRPDLAKD